MKIRKQHDDNLLVTLLIIAIILFVIDIIAGITVFICSGGILF